MQEETDAKHYLILGAGPVGLAVARSFKSANVPYEQVDAANDVGGNWCHGAYDSAHVLSSRDVMEYPEFPMPPSYPDFPSRVQMHAYYKSYALHYDLIGRIRFNTQVVQVVPVRNSQWEVDFENAPKQVYKGVVICNGHHWCRQYPKFPGVFSGESFHSKDYASGEQLKNKRVLVVGAGNSAFDIASESARRSTSTFLSVRRGIWVFPKTFMGKPISSINSPILTWLPGWIKETLVKAMLKVTVGHPREYGLPDPKMKVFERHPTVNTDTLMLIKHGRIQVKGGVKRLHASQVEFEDGSIEDIDLVVFATGFEVSFPFLPAELIRVDEKVVRVYGYSMYDDFKGIYIVGWFQARGGVGSLASPYADLLTQLIKVQERVKTPIGLTLRELGEQLPDTHVIGGPMVLTWIKRTIKRLGKIEKKAQGLDARMGDFENPVYSNGKEVMHQEVASQNHKPVETAEVDR